MSGAHGHEGRFRTELELERSIRPPLQTRCHPRPGESARLVNGGVYTRPEPRHTGLLATQTLHISRTKQQNPATSGRQIWVSRGVLRGAKTMKKLTPGSQLVQTSAMPERAGRPFRSQP
jgi:hypothetical protein